jgi:hypothetical protein
MWTGLRPRLVAALTGVPDAGPVLELGAGSGLGTDVLLDTLPHDVLAAEPSAALRGVLLARLADRDAERVTVFPGGATEVPLPDRLAAVVGMHMVGHLAPAARKRLWAAVAERLVPGGPVVLNVQPPEAAEPVPEWPWSGVTVGGLAYEGTGSAEPTGPDSVRWRMRYRSRDERRLRLVDRHRAGPRRRTGRRRARHERGRGPGHREEAADLTGLTGGFATPLRPRRGGAARPCRMACPASMP